MGCSCNKGALNRQQISKQGWLQEVPEDRLAFARRACGVYFSPVGGARKAGSGVQTVLWGVLVVGPSVALALLGFAVVRRFVPMEFRETHSADTAVIFGALYVMYGLIVGFSAYFASYQYDNAQRTAEAEASSVQELHRLAEGFPDGERQEVQELAASYARTVIEEGWPLMEDGRVSAKAGAISVELRRGVLTFEPGTDWEDGLYERSLALVGELDQNRALRLLEVREGIPSILWVVLILGGATTVRFTYPL